MMFGQFYIAHKHPNMMYGQLYIVHKHPNMMYGQPYIVHGHPKIEAVTDPVCLMKVAKFQFAQLTAHMAAQAPMMTIHPDPEMPQAPKPLQCPKKLIPRHQSAMRSECLVAATGVKSRSCGQKFEIPISLTHWVNPLCVGFRPQPPTRPALALLVINLNCGLEVESMEFCC